MMINKYILKTMLLLSFMTLGTDVVGQSNKVRPDAYGGDRTVWISPLISDKVSSGVNNPGFAIDNSDTTFAQINSFGGVAAYIGAYSDRFTLQYSNNVNHIPGNKKFYLKVNSNETGLLDALLGGGLGDLLKDVLNVVIGGQHVTEFKLKNAAGSDVISVSTNNVANNQDKVNVVIDKNGYYYTIFYPKQTVKTIEIEDKTSFAVLGLLTNSFKVYDAFYYDNISRCDVPIMTSYTGTSGLLTVLSSAPVRDAHQAIDDDLKTSSKIGSSGLLGVGLANSVEQLFHLPVKVTDKSARILMKLPVGLLNLKVGATAKVIFYDSSISTNGGIVGETLIDNDIIGLDLLGLVNNSDANISFAAAPKNSTGAIIPFDKIGIKIDIPVGVKLLGSNDIEIFDVAIINDKPTKVTVCTKEFVTSDNIREIKFDITQIIPNYNPANSYTISNANGDEIDHLTDKWQPLGSYIVKGITGSTEYCPQENVNFLAVQDTQYRLNGAFSISKPLDADDDKIADAQHTFLSSNYKIVDFDDFNADVSSNYEPVKIFRESDNTDVTGLNITFPQIGTYNFYAKTKHLTSDCELVRRITVYVYDKAECEFRYEQLMANKEATSTVSLLGIPLGGTSQSANAIDKDLSTHGSIFNVVSLLGIGTTTQNLLFTETDPNIRKQIAPGTPVTIKLGQEYSLLQLIGAITVRPIDTHGEFVGPFLSIGEADLLSLLVGDNVFEFTFVPKGTNGEDIWYSGVQVNLGSVLGVGNTAKVFGAYIDERKALVDATCNPNITVNGAETPAGLDQTVLLNTSVKDVLWGVQDAGLGVATALSGVAYPYLAADAINDVANPLHGTADYDTAAIFNTSVGALNRQTLTVKFKEIARPGDRVRIVLSAQGAPILDLSLLQGFTIQRYMGNVPIGDEVTTSGFELIKLDLLELIANQSSNKYAVILDGIGAPFDRVEIRLDNVVSANILGDRTYVHDVSLIPYFSFDSDGETTLLCTTAPFEIEKMDPCTSYDLSYAYPTIDPVTDKITGWNDIVGSEIVIANENDKRVQYRLQMKELIKTYNQSETLYLKIVTKRQGCIYGDAQYLKVKVAACGSIVNPMIRTRLKSN